MNEGNRRARRIAEAIRMPLSVRTAIPIGTRRRRLVSTEREILDVVRPLADLQHVTGILVASVDGLLIATNIPDAQARGIEPETVAAMSAAQLGLGRQISAGCANGEFQESVTRAADGYVATFAAGAHAVLTVLAEATLNVGRLHHEARPVAAQVGALIDRAHAGARASRERR